MSPKPWIIYGLYDPRISPIRIRYVGLTTSGLTVRLQGHICYSKNLKTHRDRWIQSLLANNIRPKGIILEAGENEKVVEAEIRWIAHYTPTGYLTNHTLGGEGLSGYKHSEETKEKIRRGNSTPEAKAFQSKLHTGRVNTPEAIEKTRIAQLGVKKSLATKKKMSDSWLVPGRLEAHKARYS